MGPTKKRFKQAQAGVSFDEARTVFTDEHALLIDDPDHSADEARFLLLGLRTVEKMRKTYDFSKARPNPYARRLKKQVTTSTGVA